MEIIQLRKAKNGFIALCLGNDQEEHVFMSEEKLLAGLKDLLEGLNEALPLPDLPPVPKPPEMTNDEEDVM